MLGADLDTLERATEEPVLRECDSTDGVFVSSDCTNHLCILDVPHLYVVVHGATEQVLLSVGEERERTHHP